MIFTLLFCIRYFKSWWSQMKIKTSKILRPIWFPRLIKIKPCAKTKWNLNSYTLFLTANTLLSVLCAVYHATNTKECHASTITGLKCFVAHVLSLLDCKSLFVPYMDKRQILPNVDVINKERINVVGNNK